MKSYPSIPKQILRDVEIIAQAKADGSNIRAEWSRKKGFYKFGSKTQMLGADHPQLGESIELIMNTYSEDLSSVFSKQKIENAVCFFEFFGPNSFAGHHLPEPHEVVLFDVNLHKVGILPPREFMKLVGHLKVPEILYQGKANHIFEESVRDSSLPGMPLEGVICKGAPVKRGGLPVMFKIKSRAWLDQLKAHCKGDEALFEKLA